MQMEAKAGRLVASPLCTQSAIWKAHSSRHSDIGPQSWLRPAQLPAPGSPQLLRQRRKSSPVGVESKRIPGTTGSASGMVAKKAVEKTEFP